ncbi:hypothetical protein [uncultured Cedecea sp.]|uniref:hypothetical protein n=1 Tax=uncultured Cedecea sp. TaxID=988762 RepID=UPI00260EB127|nr:hypothetical protein [uncultured Cedecea sp.]
MKTIKTFVAVTVLSLMSVGAFAQKTFITTSTQNATTAKMTDKHAQQDIRCPMANDRSLIDP